MTGTINQEPKVERERTLYYQEWEDGKRDVKTCFYSSLHDVKEAQKEERRSGSTMVTPPVMLYIPQSFYDSVQRGNYNKAELEKRVNEAIRWGIKGGIIHQVELEDKPIISEDFWCGAFL